MFNYTKPEWLRRHAPHIRMNTRAGRLEAVLIASNRMMGQRLAEIEFTSSRVERATGLTRNRDEFQSACYWLAVYGHLYTGRLAVPTQVIEDGVRAYTRDVGYLFMSTNDRLLHCAEAGLLNPGLLEQDSMTREEYEAARFWISVMDVTYDRFVHNRRTSFELEWERPDAARCLIRFGCMRAGFPCFSGEMTSGCERHTQSYVTPCDTGVLTNPGDCRTVYSPTEVLYYVNVPSRAVACSACGALHIGMRDRFRCRECNEEPSSPARIRAFNAPPPPMFFVSERERPYAQGDRRPYFGVELEVEYARCDDPASVLEPLMSARAERMILKSDGSLTHGVEIVTSPHSLARWQQDSAEWAVMLNTLAGAGMRSYDPGTCGMHVHVSRAAFTPTQAYCVQGFVLTHEPLMGVIAQRQSNRYSTFASSATKNEMLAKARLCSRRTSNNCGPRGITASHGSRYEVVNIGTKPTLEFRMFRGTLNHASFYKNIEAVAAIIEFAKTRGVVNARRQAGSQFVAFVYANHRTYPHLHAFMDTRRAQVREALASADRATLVTPAVRKRGNRYTPPVFQMANT